MFKTNIVGLGPEKSGLQHVRPRRLFILLLCSHKLRTANMINVIVIETCYRARILVQVTIYRRLRIGRDGRLDQSGAYDVSQLVRKCGP